MDLKKENGTCLIISGGRFVDVDIQALSADYIIACDSGLDNADRYGLKPDLVVGDFDSLSEDKFKKIETDESKINHIRYPKEKDDTDTMIAVKQALHMGYISIKMVCAYGGRMDHSMANIQTAHYAAVRGAVVEIIDTDSLSAVFANRSMEFNKRGGWYLSVFSLSDKSIGVSIRGTKYEIEDGELTSDFPLGVSNEFAKEKAAVSVKDGCLMVIIASP